MRYRFTYDTTAVYHSGIRLSRALSIFRHRERISQACWEIESPTSAKQLSMYFTEVLGQNEIFSIDLIR